jgi:predicted TIM-barrel fold metal-dependent hydrolase
VIFDTHLHLIYLDKLYYPWLDDFTALRHDATYDSYAVTAGRVGISGVLHMEVDVAENDIEAETAMVSELMSAGDSLLKGAISSCRPESTDFLQFLERQQTISEVKGFRRVLHVVPDEVSTTNVFRDNVKRLSGTGLTFDLCVLPAQLPLAIELVDHCPDVTFVLDHCGVPDVSRQSLEPWKKHMKALAQRENVVAKISGIMAYGNPDTWSLQDIRPYVEYTIDAFGWKRVVWGSDSPVCTLAGRIETWVAATHALIESCSSDEKAALLHKNAIELWSISNRANLE